MSETDGGPGDASGPGKVSGPGEASGAGRAAFTGDAGGGWEPGAPGVLRLPSGRLVRGRGLRRPLPDGPPPDLTVQLRGRRPAPPAWESRWVRWPDFLLPTDPAELAAALREVLDRARDERVEVACGGGYGRTGTALACLAVLDGLAPGAAIAHVREGYARRAVETPWQRRFVFRFGREGGLF